MIDGGGGRVAVSPAGLRMAASQVRAFAGRVEGAVSRPGDVGDLGHATLAAALATVHINWFAHNVGVADQVAEAAGYLAGAAGSFEQVDARLAGVGGS